MYGRSTTPPPFALSVVYVIVACRGPRAGCLEQARPPLYGNKAGREAHPNCHTNLVSFMLFVVVVTVKLITDP